MRPHIGDLLRGVKRTFGEVIVPSLTDPFAVEQATFMALVLEHIVARWDQAEEFHRVENTELRQALSEAVERLRSASQERPDVRSLLEAISRRVDEEDAAGHLPRTPETVAQANVALKEYLSKLLECIEDGTGADGASETRRVVHACHAYMKRQLEREREWVRIGEFNW
ncbi:MAG: hypothetical protein HY899_03995 [Deltaproteobacteria bacterium]|nr:hypothetical protein [Deltaproteobacteria bacterium]